MDISFTIEGLDKIAQASESIRRNIESEISKGLYAGAQQIATDYKKSVMEGGKSGRIYKRRSVIHQASAPGESPASDTGALVSRIYVELESTFASIMRVATNYAMLLEFGTSKMAARPAAIPAAEKNRSWVMERLSEAVRRGMGS